MFFGEAAQLIIVVLAAVFEFSILASCVDQDFIGHASLIERDRAPLDLDTVFAVGGLLQETLTFVVFLRFGVGTIGMVNSATPDIDIEVFLLAYAQIITAERCFLSI
jgi:hypothetical protein